MKRILLIALISFTAGIMKAHLLPEKHQTIRPEIRIIPINALPDYNVPFKVNPYCRFPYWKIKPVPSKQNKLAVPSTRTKLARIQLRHLVSV